MDATETHEVDQLMQARRDQAEALARDVVAYHAVLSEYGKMPPEMVEAMVADFAEKWVGGVTNPAPEFALWGE